MAIGDVQDQEDPIFWNLYQWAGNTWAWFGKHDSPMPPSEEVLANYVDTNGNLRFPNGGYFSAMPQYDHGLGAEVERIKLRLADPLAPSVASAAAVPPPPAATPVDPNAGSSPAALALQQVLQAIEQSRAAVEQTRQAMSDLERRMLERMTERMESGGSRFGNLLSQPPHYPPPDPAAGAGGMALAVEMAKAFAQMGQGRRGGEDNLGPLLVQMNATQAKITADAQAAQTQLLATLLPLIAGGGGGKVAAPPEDEWTVTAKKMLLKKALSDDPKGEPEPSTLDVIDKVADRAGQLLLARLDPKGFADLQKSRLAAEDDREAQEAPAGRGAPAAPAGRSAEPTADEVARYMSTPAGIMATLNAPDGEKVLQSLKSIVGELDPMQRTVFLQELGIKTEPASDK